MAARRLTGSRPVRRRPRKVRFHSRRGKSARRLFAPHRPLSTERVFAAHASRALTVNRAKTVKLKQVKLAKYKAAGAHRGFPVRKKAAAYKAAGKKAPAAWVKPRTKAAKFKAARAKQVS